MTLRMIPSPARSMPTRRYRAEPALLAWLAFLALVCATPVASAADPTNGPPVITGKRPAPTDSSTHQTKSEALYWYDGQRRRQVVTDSSRVAHFGTDRQAGGAPALIDADSSAAKSAGINVSPVLLDANSGRLAGALPGGVMMHTRMSLTPAQAQRLAESFGASSVRPIGASGTLWRVDAPTGLASLELANRIHESGQVEQASPDWWRPRQLK